MTGAGPFLVHVQGKHGCPGPICVPASKAGQEGWEDHSLCLQAVQSLPVVEHRMAQRGGLAAVPTMPPSFFSAIATCTCSLLFLVHIDGVPLWLGVPGRGVLLHTGADRSVLQKDT